MPSILYGLIPYLTWGTGDIFVAIASRRIGALSTVFWTFCFGAIISSLYIPFIWHEIADFKLAIVGFTFLISLLALLANISLNEGLRLSSPSLVGTISASFTGLIVVFSAIIFKEPVTLKQSAAIVVIFLGLALSTLNLKDLKVQKLTDKGVIFGALSALLWGLYYTLVKISVLELGWFWPLYFLLLLFPLIHIYARATGQRIENPISNRVLLPVMTSTSLLRAGEFTFNYGLAFGTTSLIAPVAGAYPTLFAVIAFFVFKDPLSRQQILGIITSLLGIVILGIVSV